MYEDLLLIFVGRFWLFLVGILEVFRAFKISLVLIYHNQQMWTHWRIGCCQCAELRRVGGRSRRFLHPDHFLMYIVGYLSNGIPHILDTVFALFFPNLFLYHLEQQHFHCRSNLLEVSRVVSAGTWGFALNKSWSLSKIDDHRQMTNYWIVEIDISIQIKPDSDNKSPRALWDTSPSFLSHSIRPADSRRYGSYAHSKEFIFSFEVRCLQHSACLRFRNVWEIFQWSKIMHLQLRCVAHIFYYQKNAIHGTCQSMQMRSELTRQSGRRFWTSPADNARCAHLQQFC